MPIEKPTIEFKDGKKLTKFPDGVVREQTPEDAERYRQFLLREKERIDRHLALLDDDINKMVLSKKVV
ncbi:MAG: hypothetical protein Q8R05_04295 [Candidatus Omnitrophota bacterium]|nr:hypothetical protein [Candidatus Omnitrophota bacterium]